MIAKVEELRAEEEVAPVEEVTPADVPAMNQKTEEEKEAAAKAKEEEKNKLLSNLIKKPVNIGPNRIELMGF